MNETPREAFVEMLPARAGHNLRHLDTVRQHYTGPGCPCHPERVAHAGSEER